MSYLFIWIAILMNVPLFPFRNLVSLFEVEWAHHIVLPALS